MTSLDIAILKHIPLHKEIPLFGNADELNMDLFSSHISTQLHYENIQCHIRERRWKEPEDLLQGLGTKPIVTAIEVSPLDPPIYWVMPKKDRSELIQEIGSQQLQKKIFSSSVLEDGYFRYILLEAMNSLQKLDPIQQMSLNLIEDETLPKENAFCIDIEITLKEKSYWGRLIISDSFRKQWIQHFSAFPLEYASKVESKHIELKLALNIGSVLLSLKDIKKLKPLDILIPDSLTYSPESIEASGIITLAATPLLKAKISQNQIQIVDFILHPKEHNMQEDIKFDTDAEDTVTIKELPLEVCIELSRFTISLGELLKLKAGNVLDLPPHTEQRVSLSINGKKVGHAELVSLGETWGLKILDI